MKDEKISETAVKFVDVIPETVVPEKSVETVVNVEQEIRNLASIQAQQDLINASFDAQKIKIQGKIDRAAKLGVTEKSIIDAKTAQAESLDVNSIDVI